VKQYYPNVLSGVIVFMQKGAHPRIYFLPWLSCVCYPNVLGEAVYYPNVLSGVIVFRQKGAHPRIYFLPWLNYLPSCVYVSVLIVPAQKEAHPRI
jgi:hypothetical protein